MKTLAFKTIGSAIGQTVWLLIIGKGYRDKPIREIERLVSRPVVLQQIKTCSKGKQSVACLSCAVVSIEVKEKFVTEELDLQVK